jgi:hypothetical protein
MLMLLPSFIVVAKGTQVTPLALITITRPSNMSPTAGQYFLDCSRGLLPEVAY